MSCIDWDIMNAHATTLLSLPAQWLPTLQQATDTVDIATITSGYLLIVGAEIGDKSQLVCMTLAARNKKHIFPVFAGAVSAFALLNLLAVLSGAMIANWSSPYYLAWAVMLLFLYYGIKSWRDAAEDEHVSVARRTHSILWTSFSLIFVAELGDKTQLAVAGLSTELHALPVWIGATLALATTTALAVLVGNKLLGRLPMHWVHRFSGSLFLGFAAYVLMSRILGAV